jgi:cation:H+ antiporter
MLALIVTFLFLAAVIVASGMYLSKYADALADLTGLGRTLGGMVLLASATSLPELAVDCKAALIDAPDMAVGAVLGSSIFNLLILGVLDLCHGRKDRIISPVSAHHALAAISTIILTAVVVGFLLLKEFSVQWQEVGLGTVLAFVMYVASLRLIYLDQKLMSRSGKDTDASDPAEMTMRRATIGYAVTTLIILIAASYLAPTADELARVTNLGGTFIGSTLVALTTSLPEVVTSTAAVRMGAFDLAVGNVLGSNAFNMAILLPVDILYRKGSLLQDAELANGVTGTAVILVTGILTLGLLYRPQKRYWLIEPDAILVVLLAGASFVALYYLTPAAM